MSRKTFQIIFLLIVLFGFLLATRAAYVVLTNPAVHQPSSGLALVVFLSVLLLLTSFATIVYLLLSGQSKLQEELAARTRTLQQKIAELARSKFYLDRVADAVIAMDDRGRILYANRAVGHIFHLRAKEIVGQTRWTCFGKTVGRAMKNAEKMLRDCDTWETEASFRHPDGASRDLLLTFVCLREDGNHRRVGILVLIRDITERKAVERAKSQFVYMASHQLRAPMTQLRWLVEQAQSEPRVSARMREQLGSMQKIILLENKFVKDLLNASRIERGALKLTMEDVPVMDLIGDALRALQKDAEDGKVMLRVTGPAKAVRLRIDREKIAEALRNIAHNAIKFSPARGTVRVEASIDRERGEAIIMIADEGPGIPEELWGGLFEVKIVPLTDSRSGAGLGLYLSKNFVEASGGRLRFETSTNGTVFYVTLPLADRQPSKGTSEKARARSLPNL